MEQKVENSDLILKFNYDLTASKVQEIRDLTLIKIENFKDVDNIVFDMRNVEYIDSVGITFVIATFKTINKENKKFKMINTSEEIQDLFVLMRLDEIIDIS